MAKIVATAPDEESKCDPEKAGVIFDEVAKFASYGFNKSHAAAYALVSYHTAYLKRHHPYEFMASSMNLDIDKTDKLAAFHREACASGIVIALPDINLSRPTFSVERGPDRRPAALRWGLAAVRGVGLGVMERICAIRDADGPFRSLHDLCDRTAGTLGLSSRVYENLIKAGACDRFGATRAAMLAGLGLAMRGAQAEVKRREAGQGSLFSLGMSLPTAPTLPALPEMDRFAKLAAEFEVLGTYLSDHPLKAVSGILRARRTLTLSHIMAADEPPTGIQRIGAMVLGVRINSTKAGDRMARFIASDWTGAMEAVCFPKDWVRVRDLVHDKTAYILECFVEEKEGEKQLIIKGVEPLPMTLAAAAA